ncbi:Cytochrome P450 81E8 [Zea mays]|uniref:Cytochrome P450 81E8 n=1 Tax=Zea mays TaxID=4577 RepID=A0A317YG72_MAIZE|nr:Cytochrome P450 81E8 [Zea mays]
METANVIILSFFFIFAIHRLLNRLHNRSTKMKQLPPGPLAIPVLGHLYLLLEKNIHHLFTRLAARYGPVLYLRLGSRNAVVVSSVDCARECFTEHDVTFANRPTFPTLHLMTYGGTTVGTCAYGPYWRHIRRVITVHLLSALRVRSMVPAIEAEVRAMARSMYRAAAAAPCGTGAAKVELRGRLFEVALSALMETVAQSKTSRSSMGGAADTGMSPEAQEFKESMDVMVPLLGTANMWDFLPVLQRFDVFGVKNKMAAAVSGRDAFFRRLIDEERRRLDDGVQSENKSMMAVLLTLQKSEPENYSDDMIMSLCFCFDWATVGGVPKVDMTEASGLTLPRAVPLEAMCKPRQAMLDVLQKL